MDLNIPKNGLFGTLSARESRLVMLGACLATIVLAILPRPFTGVAVVFAVLLLLAITVNQYHRVAGGEDPEERGE